mgnify:FL=1
MIQPNTDAASSIKSIVSETHRLISVREGHKSNLTAFKNLFLPEARFMIRNNDPAFPVESVTLDEMIELLKDDYYASYEEYGSGMVIEEYNGIAHVFESFYGKDSEGVEARGMNSYQLVYFEDRWWISSVLWTLETEENPIPQKYLTTY